MPQLQKGFLSVREFANCLQVSPRTVQNMLRRGELTGAVRIGKGRGSVIRIPASALENLQPYEPARSDSCDEQE